MSKAQMMAGGHWEEFPFKIEMLAEKPKNNGRLTEEEAANLQGTLFVHDFGRPEIGMQIRWTWVLDEAQRIVACRYELFGSPVLRAVADMAALLCRNKSLDEAAKINYKSLEYFLRDHPSNPALPEERRYLILWVLRSIAAAVAAAKGEALPESPTVCGCVDADLATIEAAIREFDLDSVEGIGHYTGAGALCGRCVAPRADSAPREHYLIDILRRVRREIEEEHKAAGTLSDKPFKEMNVEEKKAAINAVIDEHIRQMLIMDGGDMEILDVKENGQHTDIYIRYLGACSGCASASTGTLFAIEGILKQKLDPDIRVLPL
jgi:NifU-like protein